MDEPETVLEPLPYHLELRDYLKSQERELWNWFSSTQARTDYTEKLRLELLKTTYRLDAESHPELYQYVAEAKAGLGLNIPVTLYQAQNAPQLNATLFFLPGEGHVVFAGPAITLLSGEEIRSVIGHELAHYHLWEREEGDFHIAGRLVHAVAADPRATRSHLQTARMLQLYTEIFADRGSFCVTRDPHPVIAGLVKMETGLGTVSATSYLKQAEEIFANGNVSTEGVSHPETFIRARALSLWQEQGEAAGAAIREMIEGRVGPGNLDLVAQKQLAAATRRLIEVLLRPKWFQTPATLGHAKLFFPDFSPASGTEDGLPEALRSENGALKEYLCYVLLDFAHADAELGEAALAATLDLSRQLDCEAEFEKVAAKELKMRVREVRRIKERAGDILKKAEAGGD